MGLGEEGARGRLQSVQASREIIIVVAVADVLLVVAVDGAQATNALPPGRKRSNSKDSAIFTKWTTTFTVPNSRAATK